MSEREEYTVVRHDESEGAQDALAAAVRLVATAMDSLEKTVARSAEEQRRMFDDLHTLEKSVVAIEEREKSSTLRIESIEKKHDAATKAIFTLIFVGVCGVVGWAWKKIALVGYWLLPHDAPTNDAERLFAALTIVAAVVAVVAMRWIR